MNRNLKNKLSFFRLSELNQNKMRHIKAGTSCCCACAYENSGGSSTFDNCDANFEGGLESPECYQETDA